MKYVWPKMISRIVVDIKGWYDLEDHALKFWLGGTVYNLLSSFLCNFKCLFYESQDH